MVQFILENNYYCSAFAIKSVDKVGAGDVMLSLTSSLL